MRGLLIFSIILAALGGLLARGCGQETRPWLRTSSCSALIRVPLLPQSLHGWAFNHRSLANSDLGHPTRAIDDLVQAVRLSPDVGRYHNNLANAYRTVGDLHKALDEYSAAIMVDPSWGRAFLNRATMELKLGNLAAAERDASAAVRMQPDSASPLTVRGNIRLLEGNAAGALADQSRGIRLTPDFGALYSNRGCVHLSRGRRMSAALDRLRATCPMLGGKPLVQTAKVWRAALAEHGRLTSGARRGPFTLRLKSFQELACGEGDIEPIRIRRAVCPRPTK